MTVCDMCGSDERLFTAKVEGTVISVCKKCSKYGKIIATPKKFTKKKIEKPLFSDEELAQVVVSNYSELIKNKRESLNLKQEDFAKKISVKLSLIHKIETGHFEPNLRLAKKIQKFLGIKLIGQQSGEEEAPQKSESSSFTLGDFIKVKK